MTLVIILLASVLALVFLLAFFTKLESFREELDYINMELQRCSRKSMKYWKKKKRQLWLSLLLPFYRIK